MDSPTPLRILSLGMAFVRQCPKRVLTLQMGAVFAAYQVFLFWRISWSSSVTPMVLSACPGHVNTSIS